MIKKALVDFSSRAFCFQFMVIIFGGKMKFIKLCALVFVLGFTYGCQTTQNVGSGDFTMNPTLEEAYIGYLVAFSDDEGKRMSSAFVIDPNAEFYNAIYGFYGNHRSMSSAIRKAMDNCNSNCKVFAKNRKVVWEGFGEAEYYNSMVDKIEYSKSSSILYYDIQNFQISASQLRKYNPYLKKVSRNPSKSIAYAISPNGTTTSTIEVNGKGNRFEAERLAFNMCNILSKKDDCVIYAFDGKIYGN